MLFYTSILLASLVAALLARNFYKAVADKSRLRASRKRITITDSSTKYKKARSRFNTCDGIPVPSIQQSHMAALNLDKSLPAKPVVCRNRDTSWLIREKKLASMENSYRVRRRVEPVPVTLEMASKPFRKEVAPWAHNNKLAIRPWKLT